MILPTLLEPYLAILDMIASATCPFHPRPVTTGTVLPGHNLVHETAIHLDGYLSTPVI